MRARGLSAAVLVTAVLIAACTAERSDDTADDAPAPGEQAAPDAAVPTPIELPDTPAGDALGWVLDAVGTAPGDDEVTARFAPLFLDQIPAASVQDLFGSQLPGDPPPVATGLRSETPHRVVAEVEFGGEPWLVDVGVEPDGDHRIDYLWFGPRGADHGGQVPIPASPAGDALGWFFDVLGTEPDDDELDRQLAPELLAQVSHDEFRAQLAATPADPPPVLRSLRTETDTMLVGAVRMGGRDFLVLLAVEDEEPYRITDLQALPGQPEPPSPDTVDQVPSIWGELAPEAPVLVAEVVNGQCQPLVTSSADQPVPIASAFKLYVLAAVAEAIADGDLAWSDPVEIREEWTSHPAGTFQELPPGTVRTVEEHARAMIEVSDNTATDHLIHLLGRETIEAAMADLGHDHPGLNRPLLTTREAFLLMMGGVDDDEAAAYVDGSESQRRALLDSWADRALPPLSEFPLVATHTATVGWFASPEDLCRVLVVLEELSRWPGLEPLHEILAAPPELFDSDGSARWAWFKGGSAPGVLSGAFLVGDGDRLVVAVGALVHPQLLAVDDLATLRVLVAGAELATG